MTGPGATAEYVRVINSVRLELESAGNPAYVIVVIDAAGTPHLSPMVYATIGPAADHAIRLARDVAAGERVLVVSRSAAGRRAVFAVLDPHTLKKLHQRPEVIEESFAESDRPL
jgi:hypothetical protein